MILWGRVTPECQNTSFTNNDAIISAQEPPDNRSPCMATRTCRFSSTSQCWTWGSGKVFESPQSIQSNKFRKNDPRAGAQGHLMHCHECDPHELSGRWDRGLEEVHSSREGITEEKQVCCSLRNSHAQETNRAEVPLYICIYIYAYIYICKFE